MRTFSKVSFSTPDLSLAGRNDEVKSRRKSNTPSASQSTDDLAGQSSTNIFQKSGRAKADQLRKALSNRSLRGAAHLYDSRTSTVAKTFAPELNELARYVATVDLKNSGSKHRIRSDLLREQADNARTDKTKERILFAKYKAENDLLPAE